MKYAFYLLLFFNTCVLGQNKKVLVTLNPNDCGNCIRNAYQLINKVNNEIKVFWVLQEFYKGHQKKLQNNLQIPIGDNVIFSDSIFNTLTRFGSSANIYSGDSLIMSFRLAKFDQNSALLINSMVNMVGKEKLFHLPDTMQLSDNIIFKMYNQDYVLLDINYNELIMVSKNTILKFDGKTLINKKTYHDIFEDNFQYDSVRKYEEGLKKIAYNKVKFSNITFSDSTFDILCQFPVIGRLPNDKKNIGVNLNPVIIRLDNNLNYKSAINLGSISLKEDSGVKYYISDSFFEYFNGNYLISYNYNRDSKLSNNIKLFGSFKYNGRTKSIDFKFLNINIPEWLLPLSSIHSSYVYKRLPKVYNSIFPLEYDFENQKVSTYDFSGFSFEDVNRIIKRDFSKPAIFVINTIYRDDNFLMLLYSKDKKNYKELYDLKRNKRIYSHIYQRFVVDDRISNLIPVNWNKIIYVNDNNDIVEATF